MGTPGRTAPGRASGGRTRAAEAEGTALAGATTGGPRAGARGARTATGLLAGLLAATLAAGCGTTETSDTRPAKTTAPAASDTAPGGGGTSQAADLAAEWLPQLRDLADESTAVTDCQQPSTPACADAIDAVMETVDGLSVAIEEAGLEEDFPKTMDEVGGLDRAEIQYKVDGCQAGGGSACYDNALRVAMGPSALEMTLITDQPSVAGD